MLNPPPSSSHDDGLHAVLVEASKQLFVVRPEESQDSSQVLCVENGEFVSTN